jgi:hypothetical protein
VGSGLISNCVQIQHAVAGIVVDQRASDVVPLATATFVRRNTGVLSAETAPR